MNCFASFAFLTCVYYGRVPPCLRVLCCLWGTGPPLRGRRGEVTDERKVPARKSPARKPVARISAEHLMGDIQRLVAGAEDAFVDVLRYFSAPRDWWHQVSSVFAAGIGEVTVSAATVNNSLPRVYMGEYVVKAATFQELHWLLIEGRGCVDPAVDSIEVLLRAPLGEDALMITFTKTLPVAMVIAAREIAVVSLERWLQDGRWVCAQVGPMSWYYERHLREAGGIGLQAMREDYRKGDTVVKANMILAGLSCEPLTDGARGGRGDWKVRSLYQCENHGGVYDWMVNIGFADVNRTFAEALHVRHQAMRELAELAPAFGSCGDSGPARPEADTPLEDGAQAGQEWSLAGSLSVPMGLVAAPFSYAAALFSSAENSSLPAQG